MIWLLYFAAALILLAAGLFLWRQLDHRADRVTWQKLATHRAPADDSGVFDLSLVADLPEPARRFFAFAIEPGTPIRNTVRIEMTGELGFGTRDAPDYRAMRGEQILAPPSGLVWKLRSGPISGSDGVTPDGSWTRFWLFGLIPVARAQGPDHHRSAFGRVVAEAAVWAPASLLPGENVSWRALGDHTARATVRFGAFTQAVDIKVGPTGAPSQVVIQRWSNENADKTFREQPFGCHLSEFRMFGGYQLPTRVEGGNHFGTPDYFPFYRARINAIGFP